MDVNQFLTEAKSRLIRMSNGDYVMKEEDLKELEQMLQVDQTKPGPLEKYRPKTFEEVSARAIRDPIWAEGSGTPSPREA